MVTGAGYHYPDFLSDTETAWLEQSSEPEPGERTKCCAACQRGPVPRQFPCGRLLNCDCHRKVHT